MRHIVKASVSKTRAMRKNRARIQENAKIQPKVVSISKSGKTTFDESDIKAFDIIEVW